jgi:hypothetical protein
MPNLKRLHPDIEWRTCPSLDGHEVSEYGHLRRVVDLKKHSSRYPKGREYSYGLAGKGYPFYNVKVGDRRKNFYAHKLVAEAFVGVQPQGTEVAHNDGDKMNCHHSNLRYATPSENNRDKLKHGTNLAGDNSPHTKLKSNNASAIFALYGMGFSQKEIGDMYGTSQTSVGRFIRRLTNAQLQALTA